MLEVHITKGMRNGQKITFHGEADEAPGVVPGDIIFIVEEKVQQYVVVGSFVCRLSQATWCTGVVVGVSLRCLCAGRFD